MILKLKFLYACIMQLVAQAGIRPWGNNWRMFVVSVRLIFTKNPELLYEEKHRLNHEFLQKAITLPQAKEQSDAVDHYRIWVLWWQGEEAMPAIVKATYNSIRMATDKEVVLITEGNYREYVDLPAQIERKIGKGIGLAHLSDYIRVCLLEKYGGLWIDSTVLCTRTIGNEITGKRFFTVKNVGNSAKYIGSGLWNIQILGTCEKHYVLFNMLKQMMEQYWQKFDIAVDYLFFDSFIKWVIDENETVRMDIENLETTNTHMLALLDIINQPYDQEVLDEWNNDTQFYKLTYKKQFIEQSNGKMTYYKHIMDKYK